LFESILFQLGLRLVTLEYETQADIWQQFWTGPHSGPMATNVVLVLVVWVVVIRFSILKLGSAVSQPIVMKLFTRINDNILDQATVADF